jgi:hypothetical protein
VRLNTTGPLGIIAYTIIGIALMVCGPLGTIGFSHSYFVATSLVCLLLVALLITLAAVGRYSRHPQAAAIPVRDMLIYAGLNLTMFLLLFMYFRVHRM